MRIMILHQFYTPDISPTAHLAASLAEDRAARGDDVTVLTSHGGYVHADTQTKSKSAGNLRVERLWTPQFGKHTHLRRLFDYASYYALALARAATLPKQDAIVALTTPPFIALAGALHKSAHPSARLLIWNMDCYPDVIERCGLIRPDGFFSLMMRRINRCIFESADHVVGLDNAMIELLRSQYAPPQLEHSIIPNWESEKLFPASLNGDSHAQTAHEARRIPGANSKFTVLYLGNIGYGHDFETALDAAKLLENQPVQFAFYGGGTRLEALKVEVKTRKLSNVLLHTYVPKESTPELMRDAGCALITLRDDALGVMSPSKMHANLAMGLPILYVGPRKSNVDDAIEKFNCGVSLRHGQSAELAAAIRAMIDKPETHKQLSARARLAFESAYCDTQTLPQFDALLRQ